MTATESTRIVQPGEQVHAIASGLTIPTGTGLMGASIVLRRGQTLTVSSAFIEASRNRHGDLGWPAIVDDDDEQVRRWGRVHLRRGPAPDDMLPWEPGTPEHAEAREAARRRAWAVLDPAERREALADVERVYGPPAVTSTTLNRAPDPSIRAAAEQDRRIREGGMRQRSSYAPERRSV